MRGGKLMLVHVIEAEEFIREFSWTSRLNADWEFLQHLGCNGRKQCVEGLGKASTKFVVVADEVERDAIARSGSIAADTMVIITGVPRAKLPVSSPTVAHQ
jgi:hypothetical protein